MRLNRRSSFAAIAMLALIVLFARPLLVAQAQTLNVTNTNNTGSGSLRAAIQTANGTSGLDIIEFHISGSGTHTITPTTPLPGIIFPVTITGETAEGWAAATASTAATLKIELNGTTSGGVGLTFLPGSDGSTVKGLVINRFQTAVELQSPNNVIAGNHIGASLDGLTDVGNTGDGVLINDTTNNLIGGLSPDARNVISGNGAHGVHISYGSSNTVQGNYIGTDATGATAIQNDQAGVSIEESPTNTIGGTNSGSRNVISGNYGDGIGITGDLADGNTIQGNYIGLKANGTAALPPGAGGYDNSNGISIASYVSDTTIGGTTAAVRNVISGAASVGIYTYGPNTLIQGNYIGTNLTGNGAVGNGYGIYAGSPVVIGGTANGAGNVISGNQSNGITIENGTSTIQGNIIGLNASGTTARGNLGDGISVYYGGAVIGGTEAGARNIISGNGRNGINLVYYYSGGSSIQGNYIGTMGNGFTPAPNSFNGIYDGSYHDIIDSTNVIAYNGGDGIFTSSQTGHIRSNLIHDNSGLGIDLDSAGVRNNVSQSGLNYPFISFVSVSGGNYLISGTLNSAPSTSGIDIEFFANTTCDATGYGEGEVYLGSISVNTSAAGNASFSGVSMPISGSRRFITTTASQPSGGVTSEFSPCYEVDDLPTPPPTASPTPTRTPSTTPSPTRTPSPTQTPTGTPSPTRTPSPTSTVSRTPTATPSPTLTATLSSTGVILSLIPATTTTSVDGTFDVTVQIMAGSTPIDAAAAYINFDPSLLKIDQPTTPGTSLTTLITNTFDNTAGTINFAAGALSNFPSGTFTLATLHFRALAVTASTSLTFATTLPRQTAIFKAGVSVLTSVEQGTVIIGTAGNTTVTVTLTFQGRPAAPNALLSVPVHVIVKNTVTGVVVRDINTTSNTNGRFALTGLSAGRYQIWVKQSHALAVIQTIDVINGTNNVTLGLLLEGDANNDNFTTVGDFSILAPTFGKSAGQAGYDSRADFNGDKIVNVTDFSLLSGNFGSAGAAQP